MISDWLAAYPGRCVEHLKANSESAGKASFRGSGMNARGEKGTGAVGWLFRLHPLRLQLGGDCVLVPNYLPPSLQGDPTCLPVTLMGWPQCLSAGQDSSMSYHQVHPPNLCWPREYERRTWHRACPSRRFFKCPCFGSASCSFFCAWEQLVLLRPGSRAAAPNSGGWYEWEVNMRHATEILEVLLQPRWAIRLTCCFQSELWNYKKSPHRSFGLNISFSLTRLTLSKLPRSCNWGVWVALSSDF